MVGFTFSEGSSDPPFPSFKGEVVHRSDKHYENHRYQYAYSSTHAGLMEPKFILYPNGDDDIKTAIEYAKQIDVAIAVRTGGHQYSGASSTNGDNFQLDLSKTYPEFAVEGELVYTGVSHALIDFCELMAVRGFFVPVGQCRNVHLGGHAQTGGYGQLGRAFGLFGDYIEKIRIITDSPDGAVVREASRKATDLKERDLFWAVLGGSPGNYGILTHLWIRPLKDSDHPNSRGLKGAYLYKKEKLKRIIDFMVDMSSDHDTPRNFDLCISVTSNALLTLRYLWGKGIDGKFAKYNREKWGKDSAFRVLPMIVVYAQYVHFPNQPVVDHEKWFNKIKEIAGKPIVPYSRTIDNINPTNMSKIMKNWIFTNMREFMLPYVKRTYVTNWTDQLKTNNWSPWVSERIDEVIKNEVKGNFVTVQLQPFGGKNSMFCMNGETQETSYSWRDTTIVCVLDCFYAPSSISPSFSPYKFAMQWQDKNDKEGVGSGDASTFFTSFRKVLWGSHGDNDLPAQRDAYFTPAQYERLLAIKKELDPRFIFSPNSFCVGGAHHKYQDKLPAGSICNINPALEAHMVNEELERKREHLKHVQPDLCNTYEENIAKVKKDVQYMYKQEACSFRTLQRTSDDLSLSSDEEDEDSDFDAEDFARVLPSARMRGAQVVEVFVREAGVGAPNAPFVGIVRISLDRTLRDLRQKMEEAELPMREHESFLYYGAPLTIKQEAEYRVQACVQTLPNLPGKFVIDIGMRRDAGHV